MAPQSRWKYRINHDSTTNLSRISFKWLITTGTKAKATKGASDSKLSHLAAPGTSYNFLNKIETPGPAHISGGGIAMELAQCEPLDHVPSPMTSIFQIGRQTENKSDEQSSWKLEAAGASSTSRNAYTVAATSRVSPLFHIEAGKKYGSVILCSQEKALTKSSCGIGHTGRIPRSGQPSPVPQKSALKYQYKARGGECIQMHVISRVMWFRLTTLQNTLADPVHQKHLTSTMLTIPIQTLPADVFYRTKQLKPSSIFR